MTRLQRVARSRFGMAATAHPLATDAAVEMLERGGNAVDAAVAAALALGVCEPNGSGLGGQTMMLIHLAGERRTFALDGSSRAPNRVDAELLSPEDRVLGYRATTVPSTPAALGYALRHYGTLERRAIFAPAIRIAEEGFPVSALLHRLMTRERRRLLAGGASSLYLTAAGEPLPVGATLRNPALAETLRILARRRFRDFYRGEIANRIHDDMMKNGGILRRDDLAQIPRPIERRPIATRFRGDRVLTFPPPGAGRTLVEMLNIVSALGRPIDPDTPRGAALLAAIIRQAFIDRRDRPYDPNYYPQVRNKDMLSPDYAARLAHEVEALLDLEAARAAEHAEEGRGETTHLTVMDRHDNVVALTQSIELVFGSGVLAEGLGFLYNNYLSAFEFNDITRPYYLRPNAVPWASVAPTILFRGRRPHTALGSPGSERITSSILQVMMRLGRQSPLDAVSAPRLHCSISGTVSLEAERMHPDIRAALAARGHRVSVLEPYSFYLGCVQLVARDGDALVGVADPRRDGTARGPSA